MKYIFNIIFINILLTGGSLFGKGAVISGTITDSNTNDPLIGANVVLENTTYGIATDVDGFYRLADIPMGDYNIVVLYIGYETVKKTITVKPDESYTYSFSVIPSAIQLQETVVTGVKRKEKITEAPASVEIISTRDIRRETTSNIGSYLKGLKGVDYTASGVDNYAISIRGFNSSFSSRLLTLTDGRVANIPALRVINYSAIPQSTEDVENIEVVLGPSTALYGANAHSGVISITSKSPALSEGLILNVSGSNDDRNVMKIDGRWAKKFNDWSMKVSGTFFKAHEWEYISETEWKNHRAPWVGHPIREADGKDNNPWVKDASNIGAGITLEDVMNGLQPGSNWGVNSSGDTILIGDGEPDHGDWDGDGIAGEDWYNGYDDDGDGRIDEDYFRADNEDNEEPWEDLNGNGEWDDGELFEDWNGNGEWDGKNGEVDENIDLVQDRWYDGYDNDGNGWTDDKYERLVERRDGSLWVKTLEQGILVWNGRVNPILPNGEENPWYDPEADLTDCNDVNSINPDCHLWGTYVYDDVTFDILFDNYFFDFGNDGLPGDPFVDLSGDGVWQKGEMLSVYGVHQDCGLDGECETDLMGNPNPDWNGPDYGEDDGDWQPGDRWFDANGNGVVDFGTDYTDISIDSMNFLEENHDVWPLANGVWDEDWYGQEEIIYDCGNDGLCPGDEGYEAPDYGENDGILRPWDTGEGDNQPDTGDGCFGCENDYTHQYQLVRDLNGDGVEDFPDFEVQNRKMEIRLDYDPNDDFNLSFQTGYSWIKTQQVTGIGRYLAEGWEYSYYQLRSRYKNWFGQVYMNKSNSGNTRGYNLGDLITDQSGNVAAQLQNNFKLLQNTPFESDIVWGFDYFRTEPKTFGTILNDGPNGYDNDGDSFFLQSNGVDDNNNCFEDSNGDGCVCCSGDAGVDEIGEFYENASDGVDNNNNGQIDETGEGVDEPDEFADVNANEFGLYFQSKTYLTPSKRWELILASRLDYHEQLDEGIQFGPKLGLMYNPSDRYSYRFTYGRAFNTPTSTILHTDIYVGKTAIFDIYLKGNKDGTPYFRTNPDDPTTKSIGVPFFYDANGDTVQVGTYGFNPTGDDPYTTRIQNAPYFFNIVSTDGAPTDWVPLDTSHYLVYIPEVNGNGVLYSPLESINIPDIDPLKSEEIQTIELGFKGRVGQRTIITADYYISHYSDFFSPATIITPTIVTRNSTTDEIWMNDLEPNFEDLTFAGLMPTDTIGSFYPFSTAWNGLDDDNDWEIWADEFDWWDDKDGDGNPADRGEWGFVVNDELWLHPYEVSNIYSGSQIENIWTDPETGIEYNTSLWESVGVDEWSTVTGLSEAEWVSSSILDSEGNPVQSPGRAYSPPHIVLSSLNYGNVWIQGLDMSFTHFLSQKMMLDGNFSWYNSTDYFNELTKKSEPINAPKFKYNFSLKWDSPFGGLAVNFRHVDQFKWSDGLWSGNIGPYNLVDVHYNYEINKYLTINMTAMNIFNDIHRELIGGAKMGRQIIFRLSSSL